MSASREKKQRQGAGLSEKALQAQQQQAAQKRKTVIYTVIGVVVAVLVAALLIWRTGFFQSRATAATVGGRTLTAAELGYYYYSARYSEFYIYDYYGLTPPSDSAVRDNETGQTYREYFLETALSSAQENLALADMARKNGHTEAEVKATLDARIKNLKAAASSSGVTYSAYLKAMYGPYMSAGVFEKLYTENLLANLAYNDKGDELLDGYTEAELSAYYEADNHADTLDTFEYSCLYFTPVEEKDEDDSGENAGNDASEGENNDAPDGEDNNAPEGENTDDPDKSDGGDSDKNDEDAQKQAALAKAEARAVAAMEALKDGESVSSLAEQYELADANYSDHEEGVGVSSAPAAIREKLLSMKDGDVELVENGESGYYVVALHSRRLVQDPTRDVRHILIRAETTTDGSGNVKAPTDAAWTAAKEKIEAIQAEYKAGAKTEDSFAALANEKSDDGDGTTGGLYEGQPDGAFVPEFNEWVFNSSRQSGDVSDPIRHAGDPEKSGQYWGYHLIYYVGENEAYWKRVARNALATEDLKAWMEEMLDDYPAALAGGADNIGR